MDWQQILIVIGGSLAIIGAALRDKIVELIRSWRPSSSPFMEGIRRLRLMHEVLDALLRDSRSDRVIVMTGRDSGGVPRLESPFWTTAVHGHSNGEEKLDPVDRYGFDMRLDKHYIGLLVEMDEKPITTVATKDLPECKLKSALTVEGVLHCAFGMVGVIESRLIFLSVGRYTDTPFTADDSYAISNAIDKLKSNRDFK